MAAQEGPRRTAESTATGADAGRSEWAPRDDDLQDALLWMLCLLFASRGQGFKSPELHSQTFRGPATISWLSDFSRYEATFRRRAGGVPDRLADMPGGRSTPSLPAGEWARRHAGLLSPQA